MAKGVSGSVQEATKKQDTGEAPFAKGERVVLWSLDQTQAGGGRHLATLTGETTRLEGLGVVDTGRIIGRMPGAVHEIASRRFLVLRPDLRDHQTFLRRKAQVVMPKDAAQIIAGCALGPGSRVVEAGVGSGALTLALAWAVGEGGRVYSYELRDDHLQVGRRNLERAGLLDRVELHLGDIAKGIKQQGVDAVVLDLPEPAAAMDAVCQALRPGGRFAGYQPTVHQMESTVLALRERGFLDVEAQEVLVRAWHVKGRSVRPSFEMQAHTAWLVFGRWIGEQAAQVSTQSNEG